MLSGRGGLHCQQGTFLGIVRPNRRLAEVTQTLSFRVPESWLPGVRQPSFFSYSKGTVMRNKWGVAKFCLLFSIASVCLTQALFAQSSNVSVFATGFNNPRGLKFGPDGYLYVAEGGSGGALSTIGLCDQAVGLPAGPGPYTGDFTARISKVDH